MTAPVIDKAAALTFLESLAPGEPALFQTFDDSKNKSPELVRVIPAPAGVIPEQLLGMNCAGAGVFFCVNRTDTTGKRKAENITAVRALFVDFDTVDHERPERMAELFALEPSAVIESSPGKHHAYWFVDFEAGAFSLEDFTHAQLALAAAFGTDDKVSDLPRIMRLPGFVHRKGEPFQTRTLSLSGKRYTPAELSEWIATLQPLAPPAPAPRQNLVELLPASFTGRGDTYATRALQSAAGAVLCAPEGHRNAALNKEAFGLYGLALAGRLNEWEVTQTLTAAAHAARLSPAEIPPTLQSARQAATPRYEGLPNAANDYRHTGGVAWPGEPLAPALTAAPLELEGNKAKHLLAVTPPPQRFVVEGLLPEPVTAAIVAPGSTGKSFFLLQLAASVTTGSPFFGHAIPQPGGVLLLGAEDDRDEIARRLHAIADANGWPEWREERDLLGEHFYPIARVGEENRITIREGADIVRNLQWIGEIISTANAIPNLRLIILDPVSRFRSGDENSNEDATKFVEALELIRRETGVTVLCAHHAKKGSDGSEADGIRGASAFVDALRFAATLAVPREDAAKKLGLSEEERRRYVRFNVVKSNYRTDTESFWMKRGIRGALEYTDAPTRPEPPAPVAHNAAAQRGEEQYLAILPKLQELIRKRDAEGKPLTKRALRDYCGAGGIFGLSDHPMRGIVSRAVEEGAIFEHEQEKGGATLHMYAKPKSGAPG
jgi:hypothetical protein